jgi:phospholipase/carboxylesterase
VVGDLVQHVAEAGIPAERTLLLGFSQGACLALEFAARNARRYGGVFVLSGGLIGPPGHQWNYDGSLDGTPVFLGCSDIDPHIPKERVQESTRIIRALGGAVTERLYPGMGHTVNEDEIAFVREILASVPSNG